MKGTDDGRFYFVYILPALAAAAGSLKRYFFADVNHGTGYWVFGRWLSYKGNFIPVTMLPLPETLPATRTQQPV